MVKNGIITKFGIIQKLRLLILGMLLLILLSINVAKGEYIEGVHLNSGNVIDYCFMSDNGLYCSNQNIVSIEPGTFKIYSNLISDGTISWVSLEGNNLTRLESGCFEGLENLTYYLDLDYNQLSNIEEGVFYGLENLEELYIDGNENFQLKENMFKGLSGLLGLQLWENGIEDIPDGAFNGLDKLEALSLEGNSLARLESGCFEGLENLTYYLDLDYNQLSDIEEGVFYGLGNLEELYIDGNENFQLKENMFKGLSGLLWLELWENGIEDIPDGVFNGLDNLEGIDLGGNNLQKIGLGYFNKLNHLIYLNLAYNQISEIEEGAFYGLENLEELYLYGNNISNVDKGIFDDLSKLKELDLGGNRIKSLNLGSISGLTQLESLYLKDNNLTSITGEFNNYSLSYLDISNNCLSKDILDKIAQYLSTLEGFDIDNFYADEEGRMCIDISDEIACPINEYKDGDIKYKVLDCSNKKIKDLTQFKLDEEIKKDIDVLLLYNNEISILKSGVFSGWDNLKILLINNNQLSKIEPGAFEGIALIELYLDNNVIEELDDDLYLNYDRLDYIDISNNDLKCIPYSLYQNIIEYDIDGDSDTSAICYSLSNGKKCTIENGRREGENNLIPTELDCSNIGLTGLEKGMFSQLDSLEYLDLSDNQISKIEKGAFNGLDKLEALSLEGNSLARLESGCFEGLEKLTWLGLEGNNLSCINEGSINFIENVFVDDNVDIGMCVEGGSCTTYEETDEYDENIKYKVLDCSEGNITTITSEMFYGFSDIDRLYLNDNQISKIEDGAFDGLNNIKHIDLSNNKINSISYEIFENLDNIQSIILSYNTISKVNMYSEDYGTHLYDTYINFSNNCINSYNDRSHYHYYDNQKMCIKETYSCKYGCENGVDVKLKVIGNLRIDKLGIAKTFDKMLPLHFSENGEGYFDIKDINIDGNLSDYIANLPLDDLIPVNVDRIGKYDDIILSSDNLLNYCDFNRDIDNDDGAHNIYSLNDGHRIIDCSNRNIVEVMPNTFNISMNGSQGNTIYLNNNKIQKIEGAFKNLYMASNHANYIYLNNNLINEIKANTFNNAHLNVSRDGIGNFIYLNDNNINDIENMAFYGLSMNGNSNHIYLNNNKISNIKDDAFKGAYFCRGFNTDVE